MGVPGARPPHPADDPVVLDGRALPSVPGTYPADRLNTLSDGVFAIAMTLLALEVQVPQEVTDPARFRVLLPQFGGELALYALAFFVIGRFWVSHHRISAHVHHVDQVAIRRTIALLAGIAVLPVATALLVRDGQFPEAVALAAGLMTVTSLLALSLYRRVGRPDLSGLDPDTWAHLLRRGALTTFVFALAVPLAYVLPDSSYAPLIWWALLLVEPAARGLGHLRRRPDGNPPSPRREAPAAAGR
jgi:uncharacterized membrane protein